jgi:hypothetical protein
VAAIRRTDFSMPKSVNFAKSLRKLRDAWQLSKYPVKMAAFKDNTNPAQAAEIDLFSDEEGEAEWCIACNKKSEIETYIAPDGVRRCGCALVDLESTMHTLVTFDNRNHMQKNTSQNNSTGGDSDESSSNVNVGQSSTSPIDSGDGGKSPSNVAGMIEIFACAQCTQINFKQVQFFLDVDGAFKCSHGAVSEVAQAEIARSFFVTHFDFSAEVGTLRTYKQEVERLSAELTDALSKNFVLESALHDNAERLHALHNQIGETCARNRNLYSQLNSKLEDNRKFIDLKTELEELKVKFSKLNVNFNSEVVQHCATKDKEIDCLKTELQKRNIDMDELNFELNSFRYDSMKQREQFRNDLAMWKLRENDLLKSITEGEINIGRLNAAMKQINDKDAEILILRDELAALKTAHSMAEKVVNQVTKVGSGGAVSAFSPVKSCPLTKNAGNESLASPKVPISVNAAISTVSWGNQRTPPRVGYQNQPFMIHSQQQFHPVHSQSSNEHPNVNFSQPLWYSGLQKFQQCQRDGQKPFQQPNVYQFQPINQSTSPQFNRNHPTGLQQVPQGVGQLHEQQQSVHQQQFDHAANSHVAHSSAHRAAHSFVRVLSQPTASLPAQTAVPLTPHATGFETASSAGQQTILSSDPQTSKSNCAQVVQSSAIPVNSPTRSQVAQPTVSTTVSATSTEGAQPEQSNSKSVQQSASESKTRVSLEKESEEIQSVNIDLLKYVKIFTGSPDYPWEEFLPAFENAAEFGRWNDKTKCHLLKSKFGGNAQKLMTSIKERGVPYTFQTIKDEFEQHFGDPVNEDTYFNRFCNLKCKDSESVQSFSQRTEEIFRKAFPTEKIDAPRLKSGFIRGLPSSIREKVENRNPNNFKEAKTVAIEIQQRLLEERKLYRPEYELAEVKAVQNPSVSLSPENLNLLLNLSEWAKRQSPSFSPLVVGCSPSNTESDARTSPSSVTRSWVCDFCRKPGHRIRYCQQHKQYLESLENKTHLNPEHKPFVPIEERECYYCKGVGHLANDCAFKQSVNTNDHTE